MGIQIERRKYLELNKDAIYEDYFVNNISIKQISAHHKLENYHISHFIKIKWGRKSLSESCQKYTIDLKLFEYIDCEWKSYFLGWMFSDGNVYTGAGKHTISLCITESDKYILEYFNNKIYSGEKPLNYRESRPKKGTDYVCKPLWRFQIDSSKICKDLISAGLIQNKSLTKKFPNCLLDENIKHFIRGYFEGNGSVSINSKKNSLYVRVFSGSEVFIKELQNQLLITFKIPTKFREITATSFSLTLGKREYVEKFYSLLYDDCEMSLSRKKTKFKYKNETINI